MIAVTGATGALGRLIISELLKTTTAGQIVAVVRTPEKAADLAAQGVVLRQGDYEDVPGLVTAFAGIDALMFISNSDIERRAIQHQNVVKAAVEAGVGRVVYTSCADLGGDDPLAQSHAATEQVIKDSGLAYTFLRNNFYMDMYVVEVEIAMKLGAYRSPSGDAGAAMVSRSDIARMAAAVLVQDGHTNKAYALTGPAAVTPAEFARVASVLSGRAITVQPISWNDLTADYRGRGMPEEYVGLSVMLEQMIATNALASVSTDIADVTGTPPVSFEAYVREKLL